MNHAPIWLFDLDNTLHNATPHIFPFLHRSMTDYLIRHLAVDEGRAEELRIRYWRRYGATLTGLMRHHNTDPHHFLRETHALPDLPAMVEFDAGLAAALRRLPGRKFIFSNAPLHYAEAILAHMGIRGLFEAVFSIEHSRFTPKPAAAAFLRLLHRHGLPAKRCIMVEDSAENLRTARRLGMKTVWISRSLRRPAWVDVRLPSVLALARHPLRAGR